MEIRRLIESDLEELSELYSYFWGDISDLEKMKAKFDEINNRESYILLAAVIDGRLAGSIMGIICEELYEECIPFMVMEDLVVNKDFRKRGVGRALLTELERLAKEAGCGQIQFITEADRTDAVGFYEAAGYSSKKHIGFKKSL